MANDIIPGLGKKFDATVVTIFWLLIIMLMINTQRLDFWLTIILFILATEAVDFIVGGVHWALDSYWDYESPRMGNLVKTFRGHHVDPNLMLKHGLLKTNNNAMIIALPLSIGLFYCDSIHFIWFSIFFLIVGAYSASVHQWAHREDLPSFIKKLQNWGVLISLNNHLKHHDGYSSHYCAITGHCNFITDRLGFWRGAEYVVEKITGATPHFNNEENLEIENEFTV